MRGRKPQPGTVKEQKGAVRSTRKRPPASAPAASSATAAIGGVAPPAWLKLEGRTIWHRLTPHLRAAKLLTPADAETFARYCRNFARWLKLQRVLDREGETYETETYGMAADGGEARGSKLKRAHPAFLIADRLERQLLAAEDRFGLNPAERQRIFAARSQTGVSGDLFAPADGPADKRDGDPAAQPAAAAEPIESPIGLLN